MIYVKAIYVLMTIVVPYYTNVYGNRLPDNETIANGFGVTTCISFEKSE